jgi:hypothetical protein
VSAQACGGIAGVEVGAEPVGEGQQYDPQPGDVQLADQRREGAGRRRGEVAPAAGIEVGGQVRVAQDADDGGRDDDRDGREQAGGRNRAGSVRQPVSATTVCRRPANQPSADFARATERCAHQNRPASVAITITRMIRLSHHGARAPAANTKAVAATAITVPRQT